MSVPSLPRKYNFVAVYGDYFWGVTLYFSVDLLMTLDPLHSLRSVLMEGKLLVSFFSLRSVGLKVGVRITMRPVFIPIPHMCSHNG